MANTAWASEVPKQFPNNKYDFGLYVCLMCFWAALVKMVGSDSEGLRLPHRHCGVLRSPELLGQEHGSEVEEDEEGQKT